MMWTFLIIVTIIYILKNCVKRPHLYPPGPAQLPIVGNLISVYLKLIKLGYHHMVWQSWCQEYGDLLGLRLGNTNVVVVANRNYIKEVSTRDVFDGRPDGMFYTLRTFGKKIGLVFSEGQTCLKTKRVVMKYMKIYGYGERKMEEIIDQECKALVDLRLSDAGQPVCVNEMFDISVLNIMWRLVAGKRYNLNDDRLNFLCCLIKRSFKIVDMSGGIMNFLPFLRHVIPGFIGYTEIKNIHDNLYAFLRETITEHKLNIDVKNPKDVIDAFLIELMENKQEGYTDEELQAVCLDLLEAGMETVTNTIVFLLLHVVRNPEIQKKMHQEIDEVIGTLRSPALTDRSRMLYTEAVVMETLRISSVAAVGIPHKAREDARLGNYIIPKDTVILLAMYDLHNGTHWKDPHIFQPERFLTKEKNLIQDDFLMPFGAGKRRCIGEGLARSELFLLATNLLQKFNFEIPEGDPVPSTEPINGVTLSAKPFRIIFKPRL